MSWRRSKFLFVIKIKRRKTRFASYVRLISLKMTMVRSRVSCSVHQVCNLREIKLIWQSCTRIFHMLLYTLLASLAVKIKSSSRAVLLTRALNSIGSGLRQISCLKCHQSKERKDLLNLIRLSRLTFRFLKCLIDHQAKLTFSILRTLKFRKWTVRKHCKQQDRKIDHPNNSFSDKETKWWLDVGLQKEILPMLSIRCQ